MKTMSQKLSSWIEDKRKETTDEKELKMIREFEDKINEIVDTEVHTINSAYDKGYIDRELKKYKKSNYYNIKYKTMDMLLSYKKNMENGN
jgi:hypothetical protein